MTKAGCITLMNAENLAGVVIAQLKKKGAPIIIGGGATPMDMKTTTTLYGAPETYMNYGIMTQLAQFYGLPNFTKLVMSMHLCLMCKQVLEAAATILMTQLEGCNLVHDVGYLEGGKTGYLPFLAICDDLISMARYSGAGTRISRDHLAVDCIHEVVPAIIWHTRIPSSISGVRSGVSFLQQIPLGAMVGQMQETPMDKGLKRLRILAEHQVQALPGRCSKRRCRELSGSEKKKLGLRGG